MLGTPLAGMTFTVVFNSNVTADGVGKKDFTAVVSQDPPRLVLSEVPYVTCGTLIWGLSSWTASS
jgi:hypothetical protein